MPHLTLLDKGTRRTYRIDATDAVVGRDPASTILLEGDAAKTVSGRHARFFLDDGKWFVEDLNSRNGTYIGTRRLDPGTRHQLGIGDVVGLGLTGTQLGIEEAVGSLFAQTMMESAPAPVPTRAAPARRPDVPRTGVQAAVALSNDEVRVVLKASPSGARVVAQGDRITLGRALDCLIRIEGDQATSVSRLHSEILAHDGRVLVRDAGSRHGTYVNSKKADDSVVIKPGDVITLGPGGPSFTVEETGLVAPTFSPTSTVAPPVVVTTPRKDPPRRKSLSMEAEEAVFKAELPTPPLAREAMKAAQKAVPRPRRVSVGVRGVVEEPSSDNSNRVRTIALIVIAVAAVIVAAAVVWGQLHH